MSRWYDNGVRFQCQGSGNCCVSRGEYGFVYLTLQDRRRLAKGLGLTTTQFTKKYCHKTEGLFHLKEETDQNECLFLSKGRCTVYAHRPTQCRTWPFWPEVMKPKTWRQEVANFCPGVGKGKTISKNKIEELMAEQVDSEQRLLFGD